MKGLKIRVADTPLMFAMPKATGASPAPVAFSEVYLALQQGVVDAQENPLETIYNMKFYEVQDYISLTAHMMEPAHFVVSKILWDKLSEEEQQMLFRIGKEVSDYILDDANVPLGYWCSGNIMVCRIIVTSSILVYPAMELRCFR